VGEPLAIAGVARGARASRVDPALEEAGLSPASDFSGRFPHELSGGQRQRVALARALVGRPELVIADEPTSMLDASLRYEILSLITAIRDAHGTAFIVVTHDLALARHAPTGSPCCSTASSSSAPTPRRSSPNPPIPTPGRCSLRARASADREVSP